MNGEWLCTPIQAKPDKTNLCIDVWNKFIDYFNTFSENWRKNIEPCQYSSIHCVCFFKKVFILLYLSVIWNDDNFTNSECGTNGTIYLIIRFEICIFFHLVRVHEHGKKKLNKNVNSIKYDITPWFKSNANIFIMNLCQKPLCGFYVRLFLIIKLVRIYELI